jgi:hypothetical protein
MCACIILSVLYSAIVLYKRKNQLANERPYLF